MCLFFTAVFAFCCGCFLAESDNKPKGSAGASSKSVKSKGFPFAQ